MESRRFGVVVEVIPGDEACWTEVERAPDDGSGNPNELLAEKVHTLEPGQGIFTDVPPSPEEFNHYRWRHYYDRDIPGEWSPWAKLRAVELSEVLMLLP